ncbi:MAG: substrate-binding domain-containing protein [Bifidobacteriaceae bacterium]|nr:substrate-binding domain-containing protein [Bifidobacteriaceae bacterium]
MDTLAGKSIGHFVIDASTPTAAISTARAMRLAEDHGFNLEVFDAAADYAKLNTTLTTWAAKGLDGIIDTGVDPTPIKAGIADVVAAGIPIGSLDAGYAPGAGLTYDVTTNDWLGFAKVVTYLIDRMGDEGGGIAYINWPQVPALRVRDVQARVMIDFYGLEMLADEIPIVPGQVQDTKQKVASILTKYPRGSGLRAVVAGWDEIGQAASQAIVEAGRDDVFVVSCDGNLEALDMIRQGEPLAATAARNINQMTDICYGQMATLIDGGELLSTTIYVDAPLITAANCPPPGEYATGSGIQSFYVR